MGPPREHGGKLVSSSPSNTAHWLQWGRRVNTAESPELAQLVTEKLAASMGPPREHGGKLGTRRARAAAAVASMGPPREHGGKTSSRSVTSPARSLQWGRRVNTA